MTWSVGYGVQADRDWRTTTARVAGRSGQGERWTRLERGPRDTWTVDGVPRDDLGGCVDVDLESSAVTNTLPIHRLDLPIGRTVSVTCLRALRGRCGPRCSGSRHGGMP